MNTLFKQTLTASVLSSMLMGTALLHPLKHRQRLLNVLQMA